MKTNDSADNLAWSDHGSVRQAHVLARRPRAHVFHRHEVVGHVQLIRPDRHGAVAFSCKREWQEVAACFGVRAADPAMLRDFVQVAELPLFPPRA